MNPCLKLSARQQRLSEQTEIFLHKVKSEELIRALRDLAYCTDKNSDIFTVLDQFVLEQQYLLAQQPMHMSLLKRTLALIRSWDDFEYVFSPVVQRFAKYYLNSSQLFKSVRARDVPEALESSI